MRRLSFSLALVFFATAVQAEEGLDMTGTWQCEPAPMLIRGDWTTLTYRIEIAEQRDHLFTGTFTWTLPEDKSVKGETTSGERAFKGEWTALGVVGWDRSVEIVSLDDKQRHTGRLDSKDTIRFVHSKIGKDAWVSRSVCKRQ